MGMAPGFLDYRADGNASPKYEEFFFLKEGSSLFSGWLTTLPVDYIIS
jgi:hypothetical protein